MLCATMGLGTNGAMDIFHTVAAYDQETDSFLILDVTRFKCPPFWISVELLYQFMLPVDEYSSFFCGCCRRVIIDVDIGITVEKSIPGMVCLATLTTSSSNNNNSASCCCWWRWRWGWIIIQSSSCYQLIVSKKNDWHME
mmetsp:Transcript_12199/g.15950  ORF Transcript_12199/g.15950 Transcript_12199/m.15950 type:complete len:140 (-) Transcript_12199:49-468(-)